MKYSVKIDLTQLLENNTAAAIKLRSSNTE